MSVANFLLLPLSTSFHSLTAALTPLGWGKGGEKETSKEDILDQSHNDLGLVSSVGTPCVTVGRNLTLPFLENLGALLRDPLMEF